MSDIYLSYAGFSYYLNENGYKDKFYRCSRGYVSLRCKNDKTLLFKIQIDNIYKDCGYVYTNSDDFDSLFGESDKKVALLLITKCKRKKTNNATVLHCKISEEEQSFREKIKAEVEGEKQIVECLFNPNADEG